MTERNLDYVTVEDLFTLEASVDPDGIARWHGVIRPEPALVTQAPSPAVADLVRILSEPSLDATPRPVHAVVIGRPLGIEHRTNPGCPCNPVACRDLDEPARLVYIHRSTGELPNG
jgi:hypothetical protein